MHLNFGSTTSSHRGAWPMLAAAWVTAACAQTPLAPKVAEETAAPGSPAAMAQIGALIGDAPCRRDGDCRVIGVGAKACGGPDAYRAWSATHTDAGLLEALVARDAEARREAMARRGIASDCAILPVPGVACVPPAGAGSAGRCVLLPSAAALR